ncbi:MAG: TPM domain-containing protein [Telluria sp.]
MNPVHWRRWLASLLWLAWLPFACAQQLVAVPPLAGHVNDTAGLLSPDQRTQLESVLTQYEQQSGAQIAILTLPKTDPEPIEQFSIRVAEAWKLGRRGVDDGVILVVAPNNPPGLRRLRIEAGRGVQGSLTDAQSKRILQDVIAPHFRENQYYDGLVAGVGAIAALVSKEQLPAPPAQDSGQARQAQGDGGGGSWFPFLIIGFFILMTIFRPRRGRITRGGWGSGATGFILGNAIGSMMGGRGGGGFGGGGFGGGGFSGGGGSFDGGGASGDW